MARSYECAYCGRAITIGDEYWMSPVSDDRMFCSQDCLREWIRDSDKLDRVIDDWMEDNSYNYDLDPDDPYDRYGVRRSDFI